MYKGGIQNTLTCFISNYFRSFMVFSQSRQYLDHFQFHTTRELRAGILSKMLKQLFIQDFGLGRGSREQWTRLGGGVLFHWRKQKFRVFSGSKIFKKYLKNQRKFYNFLKIFKEILRFFENVIEIFAKI